MFWPDRPRPREELAPGITDPKEFKKLVEESPFSQEGLGKTALQDRIFACNMALMHPDVREIYPEGSKPWKELLTTRAILKELLRRKELPPPSLK